MVTMENQPMCLGGLFSVSIMKEFTIVFVVWDAQDCNSAYRYVQY